MAPFSIVSVDTAEVEPVRLGLMISSPVATTLMVSSTAARGSWMVTSVAEPSCAVTLDTSVSLYPWALALTRYGPPARTLGM